MRKRFLSIILALSMLLSGLPVQALAAPARGSEPALPNASTTVTLDNGVVLGFNTSTGTVTSCTPGSATEVVIPAMISGTAVTAIGDNAFSNCTGLVSITLPDGVVSLGYSAFDGCSALQRINLPGSLTTAYNCAFQNCTSLKSIVIPGSLKVLPGNMFSGCTSLTAVTISEGVKEIGGYVFSGCTSLSAIEFPDSVTLLEAGVFYSTGLETITLPDSIDAIYTNTFGCCSQLTEIGIPDSVTFIGDYAFLKCTSLTSVRLPEGVTHIGEAAFQECAALTTVNLPRALTSIGKSAFFLCGSLTAAVIPDGVTAIEDYTFRLCQKMTSLTLGSGLQTIGTEAFKDCIGLTSVVIPDSVTAIGADAFEYCSNLTSVTLGSGLKTIGNEAFNGAGIQALTLPGSVTAIGDAAFQSCFQLVSLSIPNSVETIGDSAFYHCDLLPSVTIPSSVVSVGANSFSTCCNLTSATFLGRDTAIGAASFQNAASGFTLYGYSGSTAETYANANGFPFVDLEKQFRDLTVTVQTPEGETLTEGFTAAWYDSEGSWLSGDLTLPGADSRKTYTVEITLDEALAAQYRQPEARTIGPEDEAACVVVLEAIPTLTLTGQVQDRNGNALSGVSVTASNTAAQTDADGRFSLRVPCAAVTVTLRLDGYYSKVLELDLTEEPEGSYDLGVCTLAETVSDRISLTVTLRQAAEEGGQAAEAPLAAPGTLDFTVTGKDGPISGFEIQGSSLIFAPGTVQGGETVTITAADPRGEYADSEPVTVRLNQEKLGSAELTLVQKGSYVLGNVTGAEANLLLFDQSGRCVRTVTAQAGLAGAPLDAGTYALVLIEKRDLLYSVPSLEYLNVLGLSAGTDYLRLDVTIRDGLLTRLDDCAVPALDGSKLSYILADSTSVTASKASVVQGELFMLRLEYALDEAKGAEATALRIVLPDGIELAGDYIALVNSNAVPYSYDSDTRTVSVGVRGLDRAVVYLYCMAFDAVGACNVSACLALSGGLLQPTGSAAVTVETASLEVPRQTSAAKGLIASGKTAPGSTVTLYDNGAVVGETTANAAGSWHIVFDLQKPVYSYSYHNVHAVIEAESMESAITTETVLVTYDERTVQLSKVIMYNTGDYGPQETVCDFLDPQIVPPHYLVNLERYPNFSYRVEFAGEIQPSEVYVVTVNTRGEATYIPTTYDQASNSWVASCSYSNYYTLPYRIGASYTVDGLEEIPCDQALLAELTNGISEMYEDFSDAIRENYGTGTVDEENGTVELVYTDPETGDETPFGECTVLESALPAGVTAASLETEGYTFVENEEVALWVKMESGENVFTVTYVNLAAGTMLTETIQLSNPEAAAALFAAPAVQVNDFGVWDGVSTSVLFGMGFLPWPYGSLATGLSGMVDLYGSMFLWNNMINSNVELLMSELNTALAMLEARCEDGTPRLDPDVYSKFYNELLSLNVAISDYRQSCFSGMNDAVMKMAMCTLGGMLLGRLPSSMVSPGWNMVGSLTLTLTTVSVKQLYENQITSGYNDLHRRLQTTTSDIQRNFKRCEDEPEEPKATPVTLPLDVCPDPSGYVYEAVPSNRLEGVTATIYYEGGSGQPVWWNAEDYDQRNPQITGEDGSYRWDVPFGNWKVTFVKDGYLNADTSNVAQAEEGWLPVPPPQLQINVGMISTAAPTVAQAVAYTDRVELEFSQYMQIGAVRNAVTLSRNESAVEISVEPLNAEFDLAGETQYATRFAVIPEDGDLSGGLTVSVQESAENYAGTRMKASYTSEVLTAAARPTGIDGPALVYGLLHQVASLSVTLAPGVADRTLTVESLSPAVIQVHTPHVTTGADGAAVISLEGLLPGTGSIRITEPVSGVSRTVSVRIRTEDETAPRSVKVTLEDGTEVLSGMALPAGTKLCLSTDEEDGEIRYTLDNTCPCEETALPYEAPIVLTEDTVLRAAVWKNGQFSTTIRLELRVRPGTAVSATAARAGGLLTVRYTVSNAPSGVQVVTALYTAAGKQLACQTGQPDASGSGEAVFSLPENTAVIWKVFVLDAAYVPLTDPISGTIS